MTPGNINWQKPIKRLHTLKPSTTQGPTSSRGRHTNSPATQEHSPELQYTGSSKLLQNHWHLITHYWTLHCTPERRNPAPSTRTLTQASLTKKHWQATCTTPPTARKLHNKENSTNSQTTESPLQMQQYNQDEETEEYPAGKGTGEMPSKPNKRGRDREACVSVLVVGAEFLISGVQWSVQ